jgi:capsular polysaccharide transport system permease protein
MPAETSFLHSLRIQLRVIGALLMREVITRYGRHNIGFLWLMLEPVIFTVGVVILWNLLHRLHGFRIEIVPFVVTGYSSHLLWRICSFRGLRAIEPNRSLLHHHQVKIMDIFISRMVLEISGATASFIVVLVAMWGLDLMELPANLLLLTAGWLLMAWFSACLGTILGCLSEYSDLVERLWHPTSYFMLSVSGTFFMVDWLPHGFKDVAQWVPMVNAIEMIRAGYWGSGFRFYYDAGYMTVFCLGMTLAALLLMADRRLKLLS